MLTAAMVQKSSNSAAVRAEHDQPLSDLMISSIGNLPLDAGMRLSSKPAAGALLKSRASKSDGDLTKYAHGKRRKYREEDYKNARFNLAQNTQQRTTRLDRDDKKRIDGKRQSRRQRRRRSTGNIERRRKKVDAERFQNETEKIEGANDKDLSSRDPHSDPVTQKIEHNSLSTYISSPQQGSRKAHRSSRSIDTSSTSKTKKQSNSSGQKAVPEDEFEHNSPWAIAVKKNAESFERRARRTPRSSSRRNKMDSHYPSAPANDGLVRKDYRRRDSSDTRARTRSNSGSRRRGRRKFRNDMTGSIDPIPNTPLSSSPKSSHDQRTPKLVEPTTNETNIIECVTPHTITPEQRCKSSDRSYTDRVMVAAESSRTPMASLKKYLKDEKTMMPSSEIVSPNHVSGETMNFEQSSSKSKKDPRSLLQIPFSDGTSTADTSEKPDEETENYTTKLSTQAFKCLAKSMNLKRMFGKQISKIVSPTPTKSPSLVSDTLHDGVTRSGNSSANSDNNGDEMKKGPDSQLVTVKPPSGLRLDEEDYGNKESSTSPSAALKPPSQETLGKEVGSENPNPPIRSHSRKQNASKRRTSTTIEKSILMLPESAHEQEYTRKPSKRIRANGNRRNRQKKSRSGKKIVDNPSEPSVEKPLVQSVINGNLSLTWNDLGSSSLSFDIHGSDLNASSSNQISACDNADDIPEDSTIERSHKINPALHPAKVEEKSSIQDDYKMVSSNHARENSVADTNSTTKPETSEDIHTACDRNKNSSTSTLTTVPPSPSCTHVEDNLDESNGDENKGHIGPKFFTITEEDQSVEQIATNTETCEKEANAFATKSSPLLQMGSSEGKAEAKSIDKGESKQYDKIELPQPGLLCGENNTEAERSNTKERKLSKEPSDDVKEGKLKKERRAKDRKKSNSIRIEKSQKEMERIRQNHEQLMAMDITIDPDPSVVSDVSSTLRPIEQRSSSKPRRNSAREKGSARDGEPQPDKTLKRKKSKTRRRGSKTKSRKKQDDAIAGSTTSPKEQVGEGKESATDVANEPNPPILNLRLLLLQSNPDILQTGLVAAEPAVPAST